MDELQMERRMTTVENWQAGHDKLCADRYLALRQDIRWVIGGMVAVLMAVMGWMSIQLYDNATKPAPAQTVAGARASP